MTKQQLESLYLQTDNGIFTPIYSFTSSIPIYDEEGEIIDYELIDYMETLSAEEHYQKWLKDKEQIDICEPTDRERIEQIEGVVGMIAEQVAKQSLGM